MDSTGRIYFLVTLSTSLWCYRLNKANYIESGCLNNISLFQETFEVASNVNITCNYYRNNDDDCSRRPGGGQNCPSYITTLQCVDHVAGSICNHSNSGCDNPDNFNNYIITLNYSDCLTTTDGTTASVESEPTVSTSGRTTSSTTVEQNESMSTVRGTNSPTTVSGSVTGNTFLTSDTSLTGETSLTDDTPTTSDTPETGVTSVTGHTPATSDTPETGYTALTGDTTSHEGVSVTTSSLQKTSTKASVPETTVSHGDTLTTESQLLSTSQSTTAVNITTTASNGEGERTNSGLIIGLVLGSLIIMTGIIVYLIYVRKRKLRHNHEAASYYNKDVVIEYKKAKHKKGENHKLEEIVVEENEAYEGLEDNVEEENDAYEGFQEGGKE